MKQGFLSPGLNIHPQPILSCCTILLTFLARWVVKNCQINFKLRAWCFIILTVERLQDQLAPQMPRLNMTVVPTGGNRLVLSPPADLQLNQPCTPPQHIPHPVPLPLGPGHTPCQSQAAAAGQSLVAAAWQPKAGSCWPHALPGCSGSVHQLLLPGLPGISP